MQLHQFNLERQSKDPGLEHDIEDSSEPVCSQTPVNDPPPEAVALSRQVSAVQFRIENH